MKKVKETWIQIRIDDKTKDFLRTASDIVGIKSLSEFIRSAALDKAEMINQIDNQKK